MYERSISIQNLMDLTEKNPNVEEHALVAEAERFYREIKIVGLNRTRVYYETKNKKITVYASELPHRTRAIAAFLMIMVYRWSDSNSGRLETHFGLPTRINYILGDVKVFRNNHAGLDCISVKDFIDAYLAS